jgi:hypothetical protein
MPLHIVLKEHIVSKKNRKTDSKNRKKIEISIESIIQRWEKNSWKNLPKREIEFIKWKIADVIGAYPPKVRPIIATIMTGCYFSIIPGAGTLSLILFGIIGKILQKRNITK